MEEQREGRYLTHVKGIVQGVGFRPFVYRLAVSLGLKGWVHNDPSGVTIDAEGVPSKLDSFVRLLMLDAPSAAYVESVEVRQAEICGYLDFAIRESGAGYRHQSYISPDIGMCGDCRRELESNQDRRYRYPFINCTNCGPRFTIITGLPYDRPYTTMSDFTMCPSCSEEFRDPADRRFHAQPIACEVCGPSVLLIDGTGQPVGIGHELSMAARLLSEGAIMAVKGLGGYHLVCDAARESSVQELRRRKVRDGKPFALMAKDMAAVKRYCSVNREEEALLKSPERPIVLLECRSGNLGFAKNWIVPDNGRLGIMLPYTPMHHLLFGEGLELLVMTSGNRSGEPICFKDEDALERLSEIADYILAHNREIHIRTDDSVTSVYRGRESVIRRSRGYVPAPIDISAVLTEAEWEQWSRMASSGILACGGELKNTFCLVKGNKAFLSHHIGDLENLETLQSFEEGIRHFNHIFAVQPTILAYDKHPDYLSSRYAGEQEGMTQFPIQHHHAHIASCMADNGIAGQVIGVAFDGTGYGEDGRIWGGEFFTGGYAGFVRQARLEYVPLPGGEAGIREPWRMALSYLANAYGENGFPWEIGSLGEIGAERKEWVMQQMCKRVHAPLTSSMGRLFDGVSAILGLCGRISYEGQAAVRLEAETVKASGLPEAARVYPYEKTEDEDGVCVIRLGMLIRSIAEDAAAGMDPALIAAAFHRTIAVILTDICLRLREQTGLTDVVLSGGVFQNRLLLELTVSSLEVHGFHAIVHSKVPVNDGGLSLGQAVMALRSYMNGITEEGG